MNFQGSFKAVSLKLQGRGSCNNVSWVFHGSKGCFQSILKVFHKGFKQIFKVSKKRFYVAWPSSQLPEQKKGLFEQLDIQQKIVD